MRRIFLTLLLIAVCLSSLGQTAKVSLWKEVEGMKCQHAKLYVYQAPDSLNTKASVIVCPGGSYNHLLGIKVEGSQTAEWLNSQGITAFVLQYRVGSKGHHHPDMIQDAQRALQYVKENAKNYNVDPEKVGMIGFSAGGHLVIMAGAFHARNFIAEVCPQQTVNLKPAFIAPIYPVVSMQDSIAHKRSRKNLFTKKYTKAQQDELSMEMQIPEDMPPTFLVTAKDDPVVMYQNSIQLDKALTKQNVPHRFLLYDNGGHGYGLNENIAPEAAKWKYEFIQWLKELSIIN
ncbi:MAG: alpha/beta hydrolase [Bacteroidales bacterium]|jgi:acetyl esterase/lipase|nr:alpha/beta hydrolase [Bacteroidales bacterium]MDD2204139.1 alpha/beta hydrolase [Bacteroidales bacterium]MDD3913803.1 alpha/beta hydrolase [Bacteroidales bacterium]